MLLKNGFSREIADGRSPLAMLETSQLPCKWPGSRYNGTLGIAGSVLIWGTQWEKIEESQALRLSFKTSELRKVCLDPVYTAKKLGTEVGAALRARLADLDAADSLADVPVGVDLTNSTLAFIPIHLVSDHYLIARADHVEVYGSDESADPWDMVRRILLTDFQDKAR